MIFRCFYPENLKLLNPTALEVNDAFFLATHTPVRLGRMRGSNLNPQSATPFSEEELLEAFRDKASEFIFSIIRGTTGSGKSHLIRWLYSRLASDPLPNTKLFLIPRAGTNLRQIIERIIEGMTGKFFDEIRQDLARGQEKLTSKGLRETLLDTLAVHVDPGSFTDRDDPLEGLTGDARDNLEYLLSGLPDLFRDKRFRRQFAETGNIIDELVNLTIGSGTSRAGRERPRQFTEKDFKLTDKLTPEDLRRADTDETLQFAVDLNQNDSLRQEAAKYVNSCLPAVIQSLLDIRGSNFTDIFRKVRRELGPSQQLIVLIEDIAAFEFIDRQLLESLIEQPDAELCPLKSAIGVTDGYFEKIDSTHIERANYLLTLDVHSENPQAYLLQFTARYLNALRTPLAVMEQCAKAGQPLPNASLSSTDQADLLGAFSTIGEGDQKMSLFPFNAHALMEMQKATHGTHAGEFNPRAFLDAVIRSTLEDQAKTFDEGKFPTLAYRKQFGPPTSTGTKVELLKKQFGKHYEQAQVVQELWGQVTPKVYEIFGVKTAGTSTTQAPTPTTEAPVSIKPTVKYPAWVTESLTGLDAWYNGAELASEPRDTIRRILRSAIFSCIDWAGESLRESEWSAIFDPASINFEGQAKILARPLSLVIPRKQMGTPEIPSAIAMQGLVLAHHYTNWDFQSEGQDGIHYLQLALPFLESLANQVVTAIRQYPAKGKAWDPLPAATEILLFAGMIQGNIDESDTVDQWLDAMFVDRKWDQNPIGPPGDAYDKILETFGQTGANQGFALVREKTMGLVNLHPEGKKFLCSAGKLIPLLEKLRSTGILPTIALPMELQGTWQALRLLRRSIDQHLRPALDEELTELKDWHADVQAYLGDMKKEDLVRQTQQFFTRAEKLKVFRGTATSKAGTEELSESLRDFQSVPFEELRRDVHQILELSQEDYLSEGSARLDRILPRIARLRHDFLESWTEFREVLQTALTRSEQQLDRSEAMIQTSEFQPLEEEITTSLDQLVGIYQKLTLPQTSNRINGEQKVEGVTESQTS